MMLPMKTKQAIKHYGSVAKLMAATGITSRQAIYAWGKFPPPLRQVQIEHITGGALTAEKSATQGPKP